VVLSVDLTECFFFGRPEESILTLRMVSTGLGINAFHCRT